MRIETIAGYKYVLPETAGVGVGYELLRRLAVLYRTDFPGPRKLDPSEYLSFLSWVEVNLPTIEVTKVFWHVCLDPVQSAPDVETILKYVDKTEFLRVSEIVAQIILPILNYDELIGYVHSVFLTPLKYENEESEAVAELAETATDTAIAEPPKRKRKAKV